MEVWRAVENHKRGTTAIAVRCPGDPEGDVWCYNAIHSQAVTFAARWATEMGFELGDSLEAKGRGRAVGIMAHPGAEYCAAMLAAWRLGWIAVPLSPSHPIGELQHAVTEAKVTEVFVTRTLFYKVEHYKVRDRLRELTGCTIHILEGNHVGVDIRTLTRTPEPTPDDGALIIFTSGTTGAPKAALHTHGSLDAQVKSLSEAWGWTSGDKIRHCLPLNHVHGIVNAWMCAFANGAEVTFCQKFSASEWWDSALSGSSVSTEDDSFTVFMGVPTMYVRLIQAYDGQDPAEQRAMSDAASKLRLCVSGSAACPMPVANRWKEITGSDLLERYGMTEIGMALSNPLVGVRKPGWVGSPLPGVVVKVVDGELRVKGPAVFKEYVGRPDVTKECFDDDGFFKTGDSVHVDDTTDAYRILGRTSVDIIKHGGYKLSALEIESAVLEHPDVGECAVCGVPDEVYGETVGCVLAPKYGDGVTPTVTGLNEFLRDRLASYKHPGVVVAVGSIPRNAMGKVNKRALAGLFKADDVKADDVKADAKKPRTK